MLNLDPWIYPYDDENDQITEEAYNTYENYLLSVRANLQIILEKDLLYQYPNYVENYQKILEMIAWALIRYRMILTSENN